MPVYLEDNLLPQPAALFMTFQLYIQHMLFGGRVFPNLTIAQYHECMHLLSPRTQWESTHNFILK